MIDHDGTDGRVHAKTAKRDNLLMSQWSALSGLVQRRRDADTLRVGCNRLVSGAAVLADAANTRTKAGRQRHGAVGLFVAMICAAGHTMLPFVGSA